MKGVGGNNKANKQFDGLEGAQGTADIFFGVIQGRIIKYVSISASDKG